MIEYVKSIFKEFENRIVSYERQSKLRRSEKRITNKRATNSLQKEVNLRTQSLNFRSQKDKYHANAKISEKEKKSTVRQTSASLLPPPLLAKAAQQSVQVSAPRRGKKPGKRGKRNSGHQISKSRKAKSRQIKTPTWKKVEQIRQKRGLSRDSTYEEIRAIRAGISRGSVVSPLCFFLSFGLYWGYWTKRVIFELSFALNIEIEHKFYSVTRPYIQYLTYTRAIRQLIFTAEKRLKRKIHHPEFFEATQYFPPLFMFYCQKALNNMYENRCLEKDPYYRIN